MLPLLTATLLLAQPAGAPDPRVAHLAAPPPRTDAAGDCVSSGQLEMARLAIEWYARQHPPYSVRDFPLVPFVPMGGTLFEDLLPPGYMDDDPGAAFRDYSCHDFTYNGHAGTDIGLHSFAHQEIGVPVFAALDGTVVYYHDGEPDHSTCLCGTLANSVIIDHGGGLFGWYWHMANGSVVPHLGDPVVQGQQIGLAASSGNSAGPHLHLGFSNAAGNVAYDPFAGPCRPGASIWADQPPLNLTPYVADFGITPQTLSTLPGPPIRYPATGQLGFDEYMWFWMTVVNLPANAVWRQRYVRPDGSVAFDSGDVAFGNSAFQRVGTWWFYSYYVYDMHAIAGTWHVRFDINGQQAIDAPIEIRPTAIPGFNRPPTPISAAFDPAQPVAGSALFARVGGSFLLDDPDYDLVRYEYAWTINGQEVRRHTFAGRADAIPASWVTPGAVISCSITPSDGLAAGTPVTISANLPGGCDPDFTQDGNTDQDDVAYLIGVVAGGGNPTGRDPDFSGDGNADQDDVAALINVIAGGPCP